MKKAIITAVMAALAPAVQAEFLNNDAPLVNANTYLDLAHAGSRVVAVGDRGHILYSDDQGGHWKAARTPTEVLLTAVCFADARHGWAVGHDAVVLGTSDGGKTWTRQYSDPLGGETGDGAEEESPAPSESGADYAMDDLYSSDPYSDDAANGDPYGDDFGSGPVDTSGAPLLDVHCQSRNRALAVGGYGYVLETRDGGAHWEKAMDRLDNADGWHLYGYAVAPENNTHYIVGEKGVLFQSRDGGDSWDKLASPYNGTFFGVTPLSGYQTLIYGLQGNVFLTANRGSSWAKVPTQLSRGINDGTVLADGTVVLVANAGGILTSHDGGQTLSLRFLADRESISAVLPREAGGILTAGEGGVRVIEDIQ